MRGGEPENAVVVGNPDTMLPIGINKNQLLSLEEGIQRTVKFYKKKYLIEYISYTSCFQRRIKHKNSDWINYLVFARKRLDDWEIIVVDDGSTDNTNEEVEKIINVQSNVSLKKHKLNMGYGKALQTGIKSVKFDWIFITDSDLQFFIYDLDKFIPLTNSYNFIQGIRTKGVILFID